MIRISETDDPVNICYDNVFKAVFTKDSPESRGALSKLLSAVIGRELTVISITANEPPPDSTRDRQIRFDVNCGADDGSRSNVEMSFNPDKFEPVRMEFHVGRLFTGQGIRGKDKSYDSLKYTYQIAFLVKGQFFSGDDFLHNFEYYDKERGVSLGGRTRVITLELAKLDYLISKPVAEMTASERWGFYFRYLTDKEKRDKINEIIEYEEGIAMASEVLMTISRDEVERMRLESEYKYELDTQSRITYARQEGRQEGIREGEQKGRQEGIREGERKGQLEILKLIKAGRSLEEIEERLGR